MDALLSDDVVARARDGRGDAFRIIYESLAPSVNGYLVAKGVQDPEAVTQDVFMSVFQRLESVTGGEAGLRRFVFTIAHARMVDQIRATSRHGGAPVEYTAGLDVRMSPSAESSVIRAIEHERIRDLIGNLPSDQSDVLLLRIVADLPLAEVAQLLGKSVGSIKQQQRRGLLALRALIETHEGR